MSALKLFENKRLVLVSLTALFAVSFALPMFFAFHFGGLFSSVDSSDDTNTKESIFPQAFNVGGVNSFLAVKSSTNLEPVEGQDFLFSVWLKFRRLPAVGERLPLLAKFDSESASRRGYALAIERDSKGIHPEIYWRDDNNNGTWFRFPEMDLQPKVWVLFAISFREGKYLGLHTATLSDYDGAKVKLSGGYKLENKIVPSSSSDLLLGAFSAGKFRGSIGPLGIFSRANLSEDLEELLQHLVDAPLAIPEVLEREEVKLWLADGKQDVSPFATKLEFIKAKRVSDSD